MVSTSSLLAFAAMCFVVIAVPGPSVLFVIGRALTHGRRTALATALGNVLGSYALVVLVAVGLGALLQTAPRLLLTLKLAGAAYLVYLGVMAIRHRKALRPEMADAPVGGRGRGDLRTIADGALVGATNPKGLVFFAAVLPQFVRDDAGSVPLQMLLLGLIPAAIGLVCDTLWGLGASAARTWLSASPRRLSMIGGAGGATLIGLGLTIAVTGE
ncbi:LysE family translocator [Streptomyces sp. NPDC004610]|uniref:LysE family translocator n=1 Tax=unclassified Streptomyces TaxID=2593676 RepID=UPI0033A232E2